MALTNIIREPRREITESAAGIMLFAGLIWLDYGLAKFMDIPAPSQSKADHYFILFVGMFAGAAIIAVTIGLLFLTHAIGEGICNSLARHGLELRPKNRK